MSLAKLQDLKGRVANAGASWGAPTIDHSLDGWNKVIEVGRRCMLTAI